MIQRFTRWRMQQKGRWRMSEGSRPAQQFLSLAADEIMVLTDRVLNGDHGTEDMAVSVHPLLLRLGSSYVEMLGDGKKPGELPIAVSEAEAWLLRSKITSGDKSSSDALF